VHAFARPKNVSAGRVSTAARIAGAGAAMNTTVGNGGTRCIGFVDTTVLAIIVWWL
jgi:hypothetical protein